MSQIFRRFVNLRFITIFATLAVALGYQNCSRSFINGEPYEGVVFNPDASIINPGNGNIPNSDGLENSAELRCTSANDQNYFGALAFGKRLNTNDDTISLKDVAGQLFLYKWPVGQDPLLINKIFSQGIFIRSIEFIDQMHVALVFSKDSTEHRQDFNCVRP